MTFKHLVRLCFSISMLSISCDIDENGFPQEGFYAFGSQNAGAVYWKNGKAIDVDGNTGYFTGAAVSGSDVYAIGYVDDGKTFHGAAYWKNGKMFKLSNVSMNQVPTAIAFDGSDMYIAGFEDMADKSFAIYWKNGERFVLSDKEGYTRPTAIVVSGSDVHIIGWALNRIFDNDSTLAMYWKNGERIKLKPTASYEMIEDIAVSGNDVYLVGHTFNRDDYDYEPQAKLWKNGTVTALTNGNARSFASEIEVNGTDVYVAGQVGTQAVYWKNSVMIPLETAAISRSEVSGLAVVQDQLIISGKNYDALNNYQGSFIWRDGQLQPPFTGTNGNFIIHCIAPTE